MPPSLVIAQAPIAGVYRVARRTQDPFDPPPWDRVGRERFDDPTLPIIPNPGGRTGFRIVYCATDPTIAYREVLAPFRPNIRLLQDLRMRPHDPERPLVMDIVDGIDYHDGIPRGVVHREWRWLRHVGYLRFPDPLFCANLAEPDSWTHLMSVPSIQVIALQLGIEGGIDLSTITSQHRELTQACAHYIYNLQDRFGIPFYGGIKYRSRYSSERHWECWAFFDDRLSRAQAGIGRPICVEDEDLLLAARVLNLTLEDDGGGYWRQ